MDPRDVLTRPADRPDAVLRYGEHHEQVLDVHLPPDDDGPAPTVFLVHGGFWRSGHDRVHTRPLAQAFAAAGWAVVTPEYRRTGAGGGWPVTFDDLAAAFASVRLLADVVPDRLALAEVTLVGHSAGGQLALWLALRPERPVAPRVRRTVALAPVADLRDAHVRDLDSGAVAALLGGSPEEVPERYAAVDPVTLLARAGEPDVVVVHGDRDAQVPVDMSRALTGVEYVEIPGADHFALIDPLSDAWPDVHAALSPPP
jgi:acetyl esterase/lipase